RLPEVEHLLHIAGGLHAAGGDGLGPVHRSLRQLDHRGVVELEVHVGAVAVPGGDVDVPAAPLHGEPAGFGAAGHGDLERGRDPFAVLGELGVGVEGLGQLTGLFGTGELTL